VYPGDPVNNYDLTGTFAPLVVALAPFVGRVAVGAAVKIATSYGGKKAAQQAVTKSVAKSATKTKTYQVYTKSNTSSGKVYTGRTSGTGTPQQNVLKRNANHHMNSQGYGNPKVVFNTNNGSAARGGEQYWISRNGGAQSMGGSSGNAINGIGPNNPNAARYMGDFLSEIGY
jgi:hypothetical protein